MTLARETIGPKAIVYRLWDTIGKVTVISQEVSKNASNAIRSDAARIKAAHSTAKLL
jgi:hypothetical protein